MTRKRKRGRVYKITTSVVTALAVGYLLLLYFPQPLFAYSTMYENLAIQSREPLGAEMETVVARAQERLQRVPFYNKEKKREVYLTGGFKMYALLSHKAYRSFANSLPFINNIIINKTDIAADRVIMNREKNNSRSLSGVIAHEVTHLFIRERYGTLQGRRCRPGKTRAIANTSLATRPSLSKRACASGVKTPRTTPAIDI